MQGTDGLNNIHLYFFLFSLWKIDSQRIRTKGGGETPLEKHDFRSNALCRESKKLVLADSKLRVNWNNAVYSWSKGGGASIPREMLLFERGLHLLLPSHAWLFRLARRLSSYNSIRVWRGWWFFARGKIYIRLCCWNFVQQRIKLLEYKLLEISFRFSPNL